MHRKFIARLRDIAIVALVCVQVTGCGPKLSAETVVDAVLKTPPFDGALAVIVPQSIAAPCDKLPSTQEAHAWGVLVASGFMQKSPVTSANAAPSCSLTLTDRGAQRESFGKIVGANGNWRVPVGGIGTDLPDFKQSASGENVTVSFSWEFFRFRGVEGLLMLDKLPQSNKSLRAVDVPPRGVANATFHKNGSSWKIESVKLVQ